MRNAILFCFAILTMECYSQSNAATQKKIDAPHWMYKMDTNRMTSAIWYVAAINANEKLFLENPHESSTPELYLQYSNGENSIAYLINNGSFRKDSTDDLTLRIRFDEEQPAYYTFNFKQKRTDIVGLTGTEASRLIEKIKKSSRVRIETEFENDRKEIVDFNVTGLKWDHRDIFSPDGVEGHEWSYFKDTDKMTSIINYHCDVHATKNSPITGDIYFMVENIDSVNYININVSKGAFKQDSTGSTLIRLRFDEDQPIYYRFWFLSARDPKDLRRDIIFITHPYVRNLIAKLKKAKKLLVQANYQAGDGVISEFNVSGLKWDHKEKDSNVKH